MRSLAKWTSGAGKGRGYMALLPAAAVSLLLLTACDIPEKPKIDGNVNGSLVQQLHGKRCALEMMFGSYAAGIDTALYESSLAMIENDANVLTSHIKNWGKEGEKAICIEMAGKAAADALKAKIEASITQAQPTKGPVTITSGPLQEE